MIIKTTNLTIHEGNYNRRVRYKNKKEFDVLVINLLNGDNTRSFQIESTYLPETDSVHLKFNPETHEVNWSPKSIISQVVEIM